MGRHKQAITIRGGYTGGLDSCPFKEGGASCRLMNRECRYQLTEVKTPPWCPLIDGVTVKIKGGQRRRKVSDVC